MNDALSGTDSAVARVSAQYASKSSGFRTDVRNVLGSRCVTFLSRQELLDGAALAKMAVAVSIGNSVDEVRKI